MDSHNFDSVKAEKENAIARFRRFRNFAKFFQIVEFFVALTLFSWSSTRLPSAVKITCEYLLKLSLYFLNPHVVFLIGNAIVITLFVLFRKTNSGNEAETANLYNEYVRNSESHQRLVSAPDGQLPLSPPPATEKTTSDEKQIVWSESAVAQKECEAIAAVIENATKQIQRFQRTQSEKLKREIAVNPRRELRRSDTEIQSIVVASGYRRTVTSVDTMDRLSNEDFQHTIEAFIALGPELKIEESHVM